MNRPGQISKCQAILLLLAFFSYGSLIAGLTSTESESQLPQPRVNLKPDDVVRIVINALADNDRPFSNAGIATTFNFASPANKENTGPIEKFTAMVKGPDYGLMVNHLSSEFSEVVYKGEKAYQIVKLIARNGVEIVYAFRLSQQGQGEFQGMWMTEAVWPISKQESF